MNDRIWTFQFGANVPLIEFPDSCRIPERSAGKGVMYAEEPVIVPVGHSAETRREWEQILAESAIAYHKQRAELFPPIPPDIQAVLLLFCMVSGFLGCGYLAKFVESSLNTLGVAPDVSQAAGFSFFLPGLVFGILWIVVFPAAWVNSRAGIHVSVLKNDSKWLSIISFWIGINLVTTLPIWYDIKPGWTFAAKTAYTSSVALMCTVTTWGYLRFLLPAHKSE